MRLDRVDDTWLPRLAARAQRLQARVHRVVDGFGGPASAAGRAARAEPALAGSIAAVAVAALLVATLGPHDPHDDNTPEQLPAASVAVPQQTLGPRPGTAIPTYLAAAAFDLRHFGEVSRGKGGFALVSLRRYVTPAQVSGLLTGVAVTRVWVRVPSSLSTSIYPVNLNDTFAELASGMQAQSRFAGLNAKTYAQIVAHFQPKTERDKNFKRLYQALALASKYESTALATPATCACVFAVLVHADFLHLARLSALTDVRAVDPAPPPVTLDQLLVLPLRPDVTTVVPRPGVLGAG
jgi:hypothetical protein